MVGNEAGTKKKAAFRKRPPKAAAAIVRIADEMEIW